MEENHKFYMEEALILAQESAKNSDVPVGCVVVCEGEIVGRGQNRREECDDPTAHAEIEALRQAGERLGRWRLHDCTLYVTLEPCFMCSGAIANARIARVYYGAKDLKMGGCGSVLNLFEEGTLHKPRLYHLDYPPCREILTQFFSEKRDG